MTYFDKLKARFQATGSRLCVGLDPRPELLDGKDPYDFLKHIIEETSPYAAAFKPNSAYFEALGWEGMKMLEDLRGDIDETIPVVLDVKRGDIGATQKYYAKAAFDVLGADGVTLSPYLGRDSLTPFLEYSDKFSYVLGVTSNAGSQDLQLRDSRDGRLIFEDVVEMIADHPNAGLVLGLTSVSDEILERIPDVPLLVPGLGAQGGDLSRLFQEEAPRAAPMLINVSRGILFPADSDTRTYAELAQYHAREIANHL